MMKIKPIKDYKLTPHWRKFIKEAVEFCGSTTAKSYTAGGALGAYLAKTADGWTGTLTKECHKTRVETVVAEFVVITEGDCK